MTELEQQLRKKTIQKIQRDWESNWKNEQGDFDDNFAIKSQNSFFRSLKTILENLMLVSTNSQIEISTDSIRRFLKNEPAKTGFNIKTLDVFAVYIGKNGWNDFVGNEEVKPLPVNISTLSNYSKRQIYIISFSILGIIFCIGLLYFERNQEILKTEQSITKAKIIKVKSELENVIKEANQVQFKCYQQLPTYDTTGLSKYYIVGSSAYKDIEKTLTRNSFARHWTINTPHNSSNYKYIDSKIKFLNDSTAKVTVKEFWHLQYFNADIQGKEEYTYKSITPCACYFLNKQHNSWKIVDCLYTHNVVQNIGGELRTQMVNVGVCPCEF